MAGAWRGLQIRGSFTRQRFDSVSGAKNVCTCMHVCMSCMYVRSDSFARCMWNRDEHRVCRWRSFRKTSILCSLVLKSCRHFLCESASCSVLLLRSCTIVFHYDRMLTAVGACVRSSFRTRGRVRVVWCRLFFNIFFLNQSSSSTGMCCLLYTSPSPRDRG